jgi:hypothetical protein
MSISGLDPQFLDGEAVGAAEFTLGAGTITQLYDFT